MCDWDAAEYEEYLLWIEAEKARARIRERSSGEVALAQPLTSFVPPREVAEA